MNISGGGWMGGSNGWGWTSAGTSATYYYPSPVVVSDRTSDAPAPPRNCAPLEWLEDQIAEVTGLATA